MAAISLDEKRSKRLKQLFHNIEAQIMMCDDREDLMLLGALFITSAKNIFLAQYSKEHARFVLHQYIENIIDDNIKLDKPPAV